MFHISGPHLNRAAACEPILRALPDWFGIEQAIVEYVNAINELPTFLAHDGDSSSKPFGFMSIKRHSPECAELYVLGVLASHHRQGVGRALLLHVEQWLINDGVRFVQVKTLSPSRPCIYYDATRRFYQSMGFVDLEEFKTLWGERNPCLMMIKALPLPLPPTVHGRSA
jgi:ribosomal protein S18 acetylase RimI-like enzyme